MLNPKTFVGLLLIVVVGGVVNGLFSSGFRAEYTIPGAPSGPKAQERHDRVWRPAPAAKLWTIGDGDSILYGSLRAKVDSDDHVLVADYSDFRIKEFSPAGEYLHTYGNGRGQGPGEFGTITDYDARKENELWVADASNGRILLFDRRGTLLRTIKMDHSPYRLLVRNSEELLLMQSFAGRLFARMTPEGRMLAEFGALLEDQARNWVVLDGLIAADDADGFVYAGHYASILVAFSMAGEQRYVVETIDPFPLPKLVQHSTGARTIDLNGRGSAWSVSVVGDEIHLLSAIPEGFKNVPVIDTYRLEDGSYLYSRKPPELCQWLEVTERHLYTVTDTTVSKWDLDS